MIYLQTRVSFELNFNKIIRFLSEIHGMGQNSAKDQNERNEPIYSNSQPRDINHTYLPSRKSDTVTLSQIVFIADNESKSKNKKC